MTPLNILAVRSMTGQGHATEHSELGSLSVEVRTVNNRSFKLSSRLSDALASLDSKIETLARSLIHRGSVSLVVSWRRPAAENLPGIDQDVLRAYVTQLQQVRQSVGEDRAMSIDLSALMSLPGVISLSRDDRRDDQQLWEFVQTTIVAAIENLNHMRQIEGQHMAAALHADGDQIRERLDSIRDLAPRAVEAYRNRLEGKIGRVLADREVSIQPVDLLREVQIYADRADISEEVTRLGSHLKMFFKVLDGDESGDRREPTGRKLDFIIQEMFRETNTIGSKAADAEISAHVVEIKCAIERMRELVQNLE